MIWGNVKYIDHYKGISHALDVALDYLAAGDFKELENGKLDLEAGVCEASGSGAEKQPRLGST